MNSAMDRMRQVYLHSGCARTLPPYKAGEGGCPAEEKDLTQAMSSPLHILS